ncbi:Sialin [Portunus trituberculatus]|uniref:Sialin n=1 Tax=Portunus trituberculatus TaxID=210409 RepID=A0A5B7FN42_PORTR|nr:Sialin [Portunus trituberculatus]
MTTTPEPNEETPFLSFPSVRIRKTEPCALWDPRGLQAHGFESCPWSECRLGFLTQGNGFLAARINPRHTLALLGCLGLAVDYCQRVNLSVAIVAMVKPSRDNTSHSCPYAFYHSSNKRCSGVFGGRISDYLGGKTVMGLGVFAASFLTLMTPLAACASVQALVITRIFLGIAQLLCDSGGRHGQWDLSVIVQKVEVMLSSTAFTSHRVKLTRATISPA